MTEPRDNSGNSLEAMIARAQEAHANGDSPAQVRMQLVQDGADPDEADAVVDRIYNDAPLSERHRASSRRAASSASINGTSDWGWTVWVIGLLAINGLSYVFHWGFWIW